MRSNGFTIIEVVIAIFILSVAVVATYNAFSIMVVLTTDAAHRLTAAYLAQEGMEIVRNIRDNNWINNCDWRCGIADAGQTCASPCLSAIDCEAGCEADYTTGTTIVNAKVMSPWSGDGTSLRISSSGFYNYTSGDETGPKFRRRIKVTALPAPDDHIMSVSVEVFWNEKATILNTSGQGSIMTEENLYNWY